MAKAVTKVTPHKYPGLEDCYKANERGLAKALAHLRKGGTLPGAAACCGVARKVFWEWRQKSAEFNEAVEDALRVGTLKLEEVVCEDALVNPERAHKILKARNPEDWMEKSKIELGVQTDENGNPIAPENATLTVTLNLGGAAQSNVED